MSTSLNLVVFGVCLALCATILAAETCKDSVKQDIAVRIKTPCGELTASVGNTKVKRLCNQNTQKVRTGCCQTCAKALKAEETGSCKDKDDFTVNIAKKVNCAEYYELFKTKMPKDCLKNTKKVGNKCCAKCKTFTEPEQTEAPEPETTKAPEPETTEAPEPETTEAPEPEITEAPKPKTTEAPKPEPVKAQIDIIDYPTKQSSVAHSGLSRRAVDGIEETDYNGESCTHTSHEDNPWWSVDMKQEEAVTSVQILNRGWPWGDRLANVQILVSDSPIVSDSPHSAYKECGMFQGQVDSGAWGVVTCDTPTRGRYVTVMLAGTNTLTLCEVKVFGLIEHQINIQRNPTEQSSDLRPNSALSRQAVDGVEETNFYVTDCTHTSFERDPWWSVDLKRQVDVTRVDMLNRGDCCDDRLANVEVVVSNSPFSGGDYSQCGIFHGPVAAGAWGVVTCNTPTRGRYVTVMLHGRTALTLCEVRVFGK